MQRSLLLTLGCHGLHYDVDTLLAASKSDGVDHIHSAGRICLLCSSQTSGIKKPASCVCCPSCSAAAMCRPICSQATLISRGQFLLRSSHINSLIDNLNLDLMIIMKARCDYDDENDYLIVSIAIPDIQMWQLSHPNLSAGFSPHKITHICLRAAAKRHCHTND